MITKRSLMGCLAAMLVAAGLVSLARPGYAQQTMTIKVVAEEEKQVPEPPSGPGLPSAHLKADKIKFTCQSGGCAEDTFVLATGTVRCERTSEIHVSIACVSRKGGCLTLYSGSCNSPVREATWCTGIVPGTQSVTGGDSPTSACFRAGMPGFKFGLDDDPINGVHKATIESSITKVP